jgi:hypothetical protein
MVYRRISILPKIKTKARLRLKPIIHPSNPISNNRSNKMLLRRISDKQSSNNQRKAKHRISIHLHLPEAKAKNMGRLEDLVKALVLGSEAIKGTCKEEELVI